MVLEQSRQILPETGRRVRTSAAMIGLAISMGAYSLLLPKQGDKAVAAEPVSPEPTVTAVPSAPDVAVLPSVEASTSLSAPATAGIEHVVQEGQTLWQLAQLYQVKVADLAGANRIPLNAVLHVGQVLTIPTRLTNETGASAPVVALQPDVPTVETGAGQSTIRFQDSERPLALKQAQDSALSRLQQKRERLKASLTDLKKFKQDPVTIPSSEVEAATVTTDDQQSVYRVAAGDTLSAIAQSHGISYRQLAEANRISNPDLIRVNQMLRIPQAGTSGAPKFLSQGDVEVPTVSVVPGLDQPKAANNLVTRSTQGTLVAQAVGGSFPSEVVSQPVAIVAPSATPSQSFPLPAGEPLVTPASENPYVENLMAEINRLREKYQASSGVAAKPVAAAPLKVDQPGTVESLPVVTRQINPEFQGSQARRIQLDENRGQRRQLAAPAAASQRNAGDRQLVATAALGSEAYDPLLQSAVGKVVSPDLPPLGGADSYLPGAGGELRGFIWPTRGVLTSGFGWRWGRMHKGIDIAAPIGTPIVAAAPGVVITAGWNSGGYGNLVEVKHSDGTVTLYAHNSRVLVRVGQTVEQGQQIAEMGSTGYSTGPHCHFEVHLPGQGAVNPMAHLPQSRG